MATQKGQVGGRLMANPAIGSSEIVASDEIDDPSWL
jgi:hypothetical protein